MFKILFLYTTQNGATSVITEFSSREAADVAASVALGSAYGLHVVKLYRPEYK